MKWNKDHYLSFRSDGRWQVSREEDRGRKRSSINAGGSAEYNRRLPWNRVRREPGLPLDGRNVPDLLTLQPGVVYNGNRQNIIRSWYDTRSGGVNGARSDQGNVTVDGIAVNDEGGDAFTSVIPVTPDSVQECRVSTTSYNADKGGTSGAQVAC